jgi:hypothetical protein
LDPAAESDGPAATGLVVADTHVHLYPGYDLRAAVAAAARHLAALAGSEAAIRVLFLTERADCRVYGDLAAGARAIPGVAVRTCSEPGALLAGDGAQEVYLIAGRQLVTRERIEVLALGADLDLPDGAPIRDTIPAVRAGGATPVLPWSPGKWLFSRGRAVAELLESSEPGEFSLADSALRPAFSPEPHLLRAAREKGFAVLAGTDPLPLPGEEARIGAYGVLARTGFDREAPLSSAQRLLSGTLAIVGRRCGLLGVLSRLVRHRLARGRM